MHDKKNILIFGGSGFIGSNFIKFIQHNNKVINFDKLTYASQLFNQYTKNSKNIQFVKQDICKSIGIEKVLTNYQPSIIINFAAETHVDKSIDDSNKFINTNIYGVYSILEAIKRYQSKKNKVKLKFVQISTDEVFGEILTGSANEGSLYNPSSPYSSSKAAGDLLIKSYARTFGINYSIIYSTNNYGNFQNLEKFIPKSIISILNNKKMTIYGNGSQRRDWINVVDFCKAIKKVIDKKNSNYNEFCVSSGKTYTNIDLIKLILNIMFRKKLIKSKNLKNYIVKVRDRPGHDKRYAMSHKRIKSYLNWQPEISLKEGLEKTIDWYLNYNSKSLNKSKLKIILKREG